MPVGILGIVQARMGSSRLPGKVLRPLAGRSVLGWVVRAAADAGVEDIVVATTRAPEDDAVVEECRRLGVGWHRGPTDDVLSRFLGVLDEHPAEAVLRLNADCPLLDPALIRTAAAVYGAVPGLHYLSTHVGRSLPLGMDVEIVDASVLRAIDATATAHHRSHVTSYVYAHPEIYRVMGLTLPPDASDLRVTLDTPQDWDLVSAVVAEFGDRPVPLRSLVTWLRLHPEVRDLNAGIHQKALELG
ncbi:cytidylyltransferase domain-containing protein [Spirillospora albida]|uniref:cytidylyltransferase domain-containing protein n=1 Tax=Spirillospora albida TaxID=58123 RepID=UPI0004C28120|nr:NTP transferase domain-containing protein [Spirillospora albida]